MVTKKIFLFVLFLTGLTTMQASELSLALGTWDRGKDRNLYLYKVVCGRIEPVASYEMQKDNRFSFAFYPEKEDFYVIGNGGTLSNQDKYIFYFKPGDKLQLEVNDSTYRLTGENTPENKALARWHDNVLPLEWRSVYFSSKFSRVNNMGSTYVDFFPLLEEKATEAQSLNFTTGNKRFDTEFAQFRTYDLLRYAWLLILTPRTAHPDPDDYPDFYRNNLMEKYAKTADLLNYPFGAKMIVSGYYVQDKLVPRKDKVSEEDLAKMTLPEQLSYRNKERDNTIARIANDTLKGEYALIFAGLIKTYDQYEPFIDEYGKYMLLEDQKARESDIKTRLLKVKPVQKAVNFSGTDLNDKTVSLSDFKGKVVVVDIWATWCGPCKKEIPFLKAMEKEYHGKDVVFLSISVDELKNKQVWKSFVEKSELTGVQLFGGKGLQSDVAKFYNVVAIPRFLVFDKRGELASGDAPRPSDPELAKLVDSLLKK